MAASRSRKRSPHPGVIIIKPKGARVSYRARYTDPDTGKLKFESLDPTALRTDAARRDWAIRRAKALAQRRLELEKGAARKTGTLIGDGLDLFYKGRTDLRELTIKTYRACTDPLQEWAAQNGITTLDQLTKAALLEFRDSVVTAAHSTSKSKTLRSDHTNNRILRGCSTVLRWLLEREKLPSCNSDDLKAALKRSRASIDRVAFLGRGEPSALLQAALKHDLATFKITRQEHRGERPAGSTARYEMVAPFVLTLLLTGMRFSEAIELPWVQVDLEAPGHDGSPAGELYLKASGTKTKMGREVAFDISPTLRELLQALQGHTGDRVFGWLTRPLLEAARKRLKHQGAPQFDWQSLRRTCGSYLANSPSIYGAAATFYAAKRLGHSVAVAEKHYLGTVKGIPHEARTIEAAMGIQSEADAVVALVKERFGTKAGA